MGTSIPLPLSTAGSIEQSGDDDLKSPKLALSREGPIGTEPPRKRRRVGKRLPSSSSKVASAKLGIHHPCNAPSSTMASHALEMFSALGNRRFLLGISVSGLQGRFWYFDRAGTVSTEEISISDYRFVTIVLRMFFATPYNLGFERSLEAPLEEHPDINAEYDTRQAQAWPLFDDIQGYRVVLMGYTLILDHVLHSSRCLYGRGTAVYSAHPQLQASSSDPRSSNQPNARLLPETVVLKLSWTPPSHSDEGELYKLANRVGVDGIPELWAACTITRLSRGARGRLADSSQYEDRELRVQVTNPVCIALHQVPKVSEFKSAFISLVTSESCSPEYRPAD
jgi:hypothetical protein